MTIRLTPRPAPTLAETIRALTDYGTTDEATDILAATQWVTTSHVGATHELPNGTFGPCRLCGQPWPCPAWDEIRALTLDWLIRASTAAVLASRENLRRTAPTRRSQPADGAGAAATTPNAPQAVHGAPRGQEDGPRPDRWKL